MKKLGLTFGVLILLTSNGYSVVNDMPRFACLLNRSVELKFVVRTETNSSEQRLVVLKDVNGAKAEQVADISRVTFVEYGNVWTALADDGKSGYIFVRVQRNEDKDGHITGYTGHLDVDLFLANNLSTHGRLLETTCRFLQ